MSIQAVAYVLSGHPAKGAELLVLLSLANHAGGDEWECWPSVDLIAFEANISVDHARRSLRVLDERGWASRDINAAPDDRIPADRRPNLYRILKVRRRVRAEVPPVRKSRLGVPRVDGYANGASTGTRRSPTKSSVEPSEEPSVETPAASAAGEVVDLFGGTAPEPTPAEQLKGRAQAATATVYERRDPSPAGKFVAVLGVAKALLAAGYPDEAVVDAMVEPGALTIAAVEFRLGRATERRGPPRRKIIEDRDQPEGRIQL